LHQVGRPPALRSGRGSTPAAPLRRPPPAVRRPGDDAGPLVPRARRRRARRVHGLGVPGARAAGSGQLGTPRRRHAQHRGARLARPLDRQRRRRPDGRDRDSASGPWPAQSVFRRSWASCACRSTTRIPSSRRSSRA